MSDHIVAVGLLTQQDMNILGPTFRRAWPIEQVPEFDDLLRAIDDADRQLRDSKTAARMLDPASC